MSSLEAFGVRNHVPLAPYTTFGVAGSAALFVETSSPEDLVTIIQAALRENTPYRIIAGGSNIVCAEGELPGLTIRILPGRVELLSDTLMLADAGAVLMDVISFSLSHGLSGLETLSGIPGSLGGAVVGNAGAYGRSIGESIVRVQIFDGFEVRWISREECSFAYRDSVFKHSDFVVLRAELSLLSGNKVALQKRSEEIVVVREKKYKPGLKCPGSFFKNVLLVDVPPGSRTKIDDTKIIEGKVPAGYLLEAAGACGKTTDHLAVATFHGNLIMNQGGATFSEVKDFSAYLKGLVQDQFGIELEEEVRYLA